MAERDSNDIAVEDVREIAEALGLGGHARPYSAREVVQKEILPAIEKLKGPQKKSEQELKQENGGW